MNLSEVLLGGGMPTGQTPVQAPTQTTNPQTGAQAPNPFMNIAKLGDLMDNDPEGFEQRLSEVAKRGIRPPPFNTDTFLQYIQTNQSANNQAVAQAGQGQPVNGQTPIMPVPPPRPMGY